MSFAQAAETPDLVGARPAGQGLLQRFRTRRSTVMPGIPDTAYERAIVQGKTVLGHWVIVSAPAGVKRILVDNVANYPKTALEQRAFTALFGAGLLGSDGELWRVHRRIMAPAFQPQSVASYAPAMASSAEAFLARWDELGEGCVIDAAAEMSLLTLQIISRTMFSTDSDEVVTLIGRTMKEGFEDMSFSLLDVLPFIGPAHQRARERRMTELFRPLDSIVNRLIEERAGQSAAGPHDLLGRLTGAADDQTGATLSVREVRDEVITIFIAGHETTAVAMSWIWYLLARHPEVVRRLEEELDAELAGRTPAQDDLDKLTYTRQIVEEAMRLYPPAPALSTRACLRDDEVAGTRLPAGANVAIAPWVLHRHKLLWDAPARFDPDRWAPARAAGRHRFAYLPFGAGPRICIGQLMAMNEVMLILATLGQRYRLSLAPGAVVTPKQNVTLRPQGLRMALHRRTGHAKGSAS